MYDYEIETNIRVSPSPDGGCWLAVSQSGTEYSVEEKVKDGLIAYSLSANSTPGPYSAPKYFQFWWQIIDWLDSN